MDPGLELKAIDARWKELNQKIREHESEAARLATKSEKLEQRALHLAKRERQQSKLEAEVQETLASAQKREQLSASTAEAAQQAMARRNEEIDPETEEARKVYDAVYAKFDGINRTVRRALEALLADAASPTPLMPDLVNPETQARWMEMVNGAT